jgi:hypothetical protein
MLCHRRGKGDLLKIYSTKDHKRITQLDGGTLSLPRLTNRWNPKRWYWQSGPVLFDRKFKVLAVLDRTMVANMAVGLRYRRSGSTRIQRWGYKLHPRGLYEVGRQTTIPLTVSSNRMVHRASSGVLAGEISREAPCCVVLRRTPTKYFLEMRRLADGECIEKIALAESDQSSGRIYAGMVTSGGSGQLCLRGKTALVLMGDQVYRHEFSGAAFKKAEEPLLIWPVLDQAPVASGKPSTIEIKANAPVTEFAAVTSTDGMSVDAKTGKITLDPNAFVKSLTVRDLRSTGNDRELYRAATGKKPGTAVPFAVSVCIKAQDASERIGQTSFVAFVLVSKDDLPKPSLPVQPQSVKGDSVAELKARIRELERENASLRKLIKDAMKD